MKIKKVESIIETLETIPEKPMLFVGADLSGIVHFLNGFDFAASILELDADFRKNFESVVIDHGWKITASLENELKEHGLDRTQIANELTSLRIETWHRILSGLHES